MSASDPQMLVFGGDRRRKPRGRPKAEEPCTAVSTWIPATLHDQLIERAKRHEVSVSTLVKQILAGQLRRRGDL